VGVEATDAAAAALAADQQQKPPPKAAKPSSKAERRALQEAQRAAKAAAKGGGTAGPAAGGASTAKATADAAAAGAAAAGLSTSGGSAAVSGKPPRAPPALAGSSSSTAGTSAGSRSVGGGMDGQATAKGPSSAGGQSSSGSGLKARGPLNLMNSTELFAHLQQYRRVTVEDVMHSKEGSSSSSSSVHPAVLALGLRYADGSITGSTARCVAMVNALCQVSQGCDLPGCSKWKKAAARCLRVCKFDAPAEPLQGCPRGVLPPCCHGCSSTTSGQKQCLPQ